ncbi:MAG: hypothetical protein WCG55_04750 [bacterium]
MEESVDIRRAYGESLYAEYTAKIDEALKNVLATIEGFRRDNELAKQSDSAVQIHIDTKRIFIPPAKNDKGYFMGLSETLTRMIKAFEGSVELHVGWQKNQTIREKSGVELYVIHENLVFVGAAARILYDSLSQASRAFYEFNGYNDEAHVKANIAFEEDALNICIATTRAIIEHAVRLDIDTMSDLEKIRTDDTLVLV